MNSREQFLLKRIRELELRLALTMQELQRVATDRDYTESVGCAFAWDLETRRQAFVAQVGWSNVHQSDFMDDTEREWSEAVKATEKMLDEATK